MTHYLTLQKQSLKKYNTLGLDAQADLVYLPLDAQGLYEIGALTQNKRRILIGKGANVLIKRDHFDDSVAFIITTMMDDIKIEENEIIAEAGVSLERLAYFAVEQSLSGYAFCEDIPGTLGGALIMNAGQYEYTIGQNVNWIEVYNTDTNQVERLIPDANFFQYRHSNLEPCHIILRAGLKMVSGEAEEELEKILTYKRERYRKQPRNYPNAGSVFKRPTKDGQTYYVWKLLEAVGLRGFKVGGASVSTKHPGFIVNENNASIQDVCDLVQLCQDKVKEHFDVDLELEWKTLE